MAGFDFNQVDQFVSKSDSKIEFLKIQDDGWYAKVRFMYGQGEIFRGETVHNISKDPQRPRYVACLREEGQPVEACPLCAHGAKLAAQFYLPVYVQSIVANINGVEEERPVGRVMIFQRGSTFKGQLQSVLRNAPSDKPLVSSMFRIVRNGRERDNKTTYTVEFIGADNVTLDQLPPRPTVVGSYILPKLTPQEMIDKYINVAPVQPAAVQPRTVAVNSFAGNSFGQPATQATPVFNQPMNNANQAPVTAPQIGVPAANVGVSTMNGNVPF